MLEVQKKNLNENTVCVCVCVWGGVALALLQEVRDITELGFTLFKYNTTQLLKKMGGGQTSTIYAPTFPTLSDITATSLAKVGGGGGGYVELGPPSQLDLLLRWVTVWGGGRMGPPSQDPLRTAVGHGGGGRTELMGPPSLDPLLRANILLAGPALVSGERHIHVQT